MIKIEKLLERLIIKETTRLSHCVSAYMRDYKDSGYDIQWDNDIIEWFVGDRNSLINEISIDNYRKGYVHHVDKHDCKYINIKGYGLKDIRRHVNEFEMFQKLKSEMSKKKRLYPDDIINQYRKLTNLINSKDYKSTLNQEYDYIKAPSSVQRLFQYENGHYELYVQFKIDIDKLRQSVNDAMTLQKTLEFKIQVKNDIIKFINYLTNYRNYLNHTNAKSDFVSLDYYLHDIKDSLRNDIVTFQSLSLDKLSKVVDNLSELNNHKISINGDFTEEMLEIINSDSISDAEFKVSRRNALDGISWWINTLESISELVDIPNNILVVSQRINQSTLEKLENIGFYVVDLEEMAEKLNPDRNFKTDNIMMMKSINKANRTYQLSDNLTKLLMEKLSELELFFKQPNNESLNDHIRKYLAPVSCREFEVMQMQSELYDISKQQYQRIVDLARYCGESIAELRKYEHKIRDEIEMS